jgi:LCP family protein required for cell wall assembly
MSDMTLPDPTVEPSARPGTRRKKRHRLLVGVNLFLAFACFAGGGSLLFANYKLGQRQLVTIDTVPEIDGSAVDLPAGDLSARNYLLTGTDNNACVDPNSPFAGGVGNRQNYGERSDTIMVIRVNPTDNQVAILSFPRDLWVKINGTNAKSRINSAYDKKDPNKLIRTIRDNFGIVIDHFVSIDFCTFKEVVDAVGGVRVPFQYATKDTRSGLNVPQPGCFEFVGDHALAYVRSRHYRYDDPVEGWKSDGNSDWGRISRQQDFVRRMANKALDRARSNPRVAADILNATLTNLVTDDKLSPIMLLQLAQAMRNFDTETMGTYTVQAEGMQIADKSVLVPDFEDANMKRIYAIFRGEAKMKLVGDDQTTATTAPTTATTVSPAPDAPTTVAPPVTVPAVNAKNNQRGVVPPNDPSCVG